MDEIKFKITLKGNDLYYFMMHHYYSKPAGIIGLVLSLGSLVLLITRWNVIYFFTQSLNIFYTIRNKINIASLCLSSPSIRAK